MATMVPKTTATAPAFAERKERSLWSDAWARLRRNKAAMVGLVVIALFITFALFAPLFSRYSPIEQIPNNSMRQPSWIQTNNPATTGVPQHLLGTDAIGRDILAQLLYGARVSLIVGLVPALIVLFVGGTIGLIAGFLGGRVDNLLMRFTDVVYAFPDTLFTIAVATAFRDTWLGRTGSGLLLVFVGIAITGWVGLARLVRGQVLSIKQKEFVESARAVGTSTTQIILRHILPNTLAPIIVSISFFIPGAILAEAILTYVGVGLRPSLDPNNPFPTSWGQMIQDGFANVNNNPWYLLFPALGIGALTMAFTFLGDGLRDALDPRDN